MCGIAGMFGPIDARNAEARVLSMLHLIRRRGPDDQGVITGEDFCFGHNRLSIIDLSGGHQPLPNEDETVWLTFNGEIYNFQVLRERLSGRHRFRTRTDAEVIIHLYEDLGPDCVEMLDGMFAFALYDRGDLLMARDPLGIKPLYYGYDDEGVLYFASEIKALRQATDDLNEFPNGHYFHSDKGLTRYYNFPDPLSVEEPVESVDRACRGIRRRLESAVEKRLIADVPLGVFLSGGLDSSTTSAIARRLVNGELHSFAVGLRGSPDLERSMEVAEYLGTTHHVHEYTPEQVLEALPHVIYGLESFDPALVRSAIPTYFVSRLAHRYVKVVLSGEGADELFAGYHYLKEFDSSEDLDLELRQITANLHNTNLQRVDRLTMLNSLEGRVPFLDVELVDYAFRISPELKLYEVSDAGRGRPESIQTPAASEPLEGDARPPEAWGAAGSGKAVAVEKWILRKAVEDYLPPDIVWRTKEKFAIGTGTAEVLQDYAEEQIGDDEFGAERDEVLKATGFDLKCKEELLYYRIFRRYYDVPSALRSIGRSRSLAPGERYA